MTSQKPSASVLERDSSEEQLLEVNWHRRSLLLGCLLAALLLLGPALSGGAPLHAQSSSEQPSERTEVRLGIVDWERILQVSEAGKSVQEQLKQKRTQYQQDQKSRVESLRTEHDALMKQRSLMAQEAFQQKLQALEQKRQALQSEAEKRSNQIYEAQKNALTEIQRKLAEICSAYMAEHDLTLVIKKSDTVLFANQYDFTEEALERLNQQLPSMTVTFPALQ